NRFFDHWRPDLALFVESDLWPNLIVTSAERGIPLVLINGRVSERSFNRWRRVPATIGALLRRFDLCLAQSSAHAERYRELRAPRPSSPGKTSSGARAPPPPIPTSWRSCARRSATAPSLPAPRLMPARRRC